MSLFINEGISHDKELAATRVTSSHYRSELT